MLLAASRTRTLLAPTRSCMADTAAPMKRSSLTIGTHDGTFHCDECLATHILRNTDKYRDARVLRSRDPAKLASCDIVVDVGAEFDASQSKFDHHQRGFTRVFKDGSLGHSIKLSSAGLVYEQFGRDVIRARLGSAASDANVDAVYLHVYKSFVMPIDAVDNGVMPFDSTDAPRYTDTTSVSSRVGKLNPRWNETVDATGIDERFETAVKLVGAEFDAAVSYAADAWLPARSIVEDALARRTDVHSSGQIAVLSQFCPWKDHLYTLEDEAGLSEDAKPLYVLYQDSSGGWRVQCVSATPSSFNNRKSLPEPWCGVRDAALDELSGIPGCVFVHANGFIGGNKTYDGALAMAVKAVEWS